MAQAAITGEPIRGAQRRVFQPWLRRLPGTEASADKEATPPSPPRDAAEPEPEVGGGDSAAATAAADPRRAAATLQRGETLLEPTPL